MALTTDIKKLCWNCHGNIAMNCASCPYCGVQLDEQRMEEPEEMRMVQPVHMPPPPSKSFKEALYPLLCLLPGAVFFLFSLVLLLFSQQGVLTLRWSAAYWYVYLGASLPLLYLGWRLLDQPQFNKAD